MASGGAAVLFDYGFPAHEYYLDLRATGTLMCHYRHHAHAEPFYLPGLQDITAHVDFTAMAVAAQDAGLDVLAYMNQASFLLGSGIGDLLLRTDPEQVKTYLPQASAVQKLVSPAEMGNCSRCWWWGTRWRCRKRCCRVTAVTACKRRQYQGGAVPPCNFLSAGGYYLVISYMMTDTARFHPARTRRRAPISR